MKNKSIIIIIMIKKIIFLNLIISTLYSQIEWEKEIRITPDSIGPWYPRAAVWGDTIHLVFEGYHIAGKDIFYMRSENKGETWSEPINLTINDPDDAAIPWITCWGNKLHVVYQEGVGDSVMYIRSLDGGNTWENPRMLIKPACIPQIANIKDTLFVAAPAPGVNKQYWLRRSFDGGATWLPVQIIDTTTWSGERLSVSSPYLHIVGRGEYYTIEIYYLRSPDKGETWEGLFLISPGDSRPSQIARISACDSSVYIAWDDYASFFTDYIFERHSHDNGNSFSQYQNLAPLGRAQKSEIYATNKFVLLIWKDNRFNGGIDFDLFWRMSVDGGNTWSNEELLSDTSARVGVGFCITGWENDVYIFWSDERNNDLALYFKRGKYVSVEERENKTIKDINIFSSNILFLPQRIKFFVDKRKKYSLNLLDLQGRKILTLKEGIGKGEEEIILKEISSGNYFIILETNEKILKKKILILKGGER